ncbi:TRAP transporter small permease subunit [Aurantivibrio plasticivorans]
MTYLDQLSLTLGRAVAWLTLVMGAVTLGLVVARYGFNVNAIALQESVIYMHGLVFLLGSAMTLHQQGHVRVDVLYRRFNARQQAWVDAVGGIVLLLPFCLFMLFISINFVTTSWQNLEGSTEPGGIPAVFLLKTLIPVSSGLLGLQAISEVGRCTARLMQPD